MLGFHVHIAPGVPVYQQVIAAVTRAVVRGELLPGAPFPSVRVMSQALRINPNTAQRAVAELTTLGLLEVIPGVGTRVAARPMIESHLTKELVAICATLALEARRSGVSREALREALDTEWARLDGGTTGD